MTNQAPQRAPDPRAALGLREAFTRMMKTPSRALATAGIVSRTPSQADVLWQAKALHRVGALGQVYYLSPDVTYVLGVAGQALAPEHLVHFNAEDLPSPDGFLVLDGEQYEIPTWGVPGSQYLRGILWSVANYDDGRDAGICLWSVVSDLSDHEGLKDITFGGCHIRHSLFYKWGEPIQIGADDIETFREETIKKYKGLYVPQDEPEVEQRLSAQAVDAINRYLFAAFQFMGEQIVLPERTALSRADRRRAERAKEPLPTLNVVRLRRVHRDKPDDPNPSEVQWTHRWMVAGHWRNQPYGPRSAPKYRARWIRPYVKGPEDQPLVVTERVTSVIR